MNSKFSYILLSCAVMAGALVGCSDDDDVVKSALAEPNTTLVSKTHSKLAFSWEPVANAKQYGYALYNPAGNVVGEGTSVYTTASFSGLLANTEYTLKVWAFPSLQSDYSTSPAFVLTATTDPLKPISLPEPEAKIAGTKTTISWEAVEYASSYVYKLTGTDIEDPEEIETEDTSVTYIGLSLGSYEFSVYACSQEDGYESQSQVAVITFNIEPVKDWRVRYAAYFGYYYREESFYTTLAYNNSLDVYTVEAWCGVKGYDISFKVTEAGMELYGVELGSNGYYMVETGLAEPAYFNVYTSGGYSTFEGDMDEGEIWFGTYTPDWTVWDNNGYVWDTETAHPSIDEICGSYNYADYGYECYTDWNTWTEFDYKNQPCTITKIDDENVYVSTLLSYPGFEGCGFTAEYNKQTMTLNVPIQEYATYYELALENDDYSNGSKPLEGNTATIYGDGAISMDNWVVYYCYSGWYYHYFCYTESYWTPKYAASAPAKVKKAALKAAPRR